MYTGDWFSLGTNLPEYSVPEASSQYHFAKPKSSCGSVVTKQEHVYRVQSSLHMDDF